MTKPLPGNPEADIEQAQMLVDKICALCCEVDPATHVAVVVFAHMLGSIIAKSTDNDRELALDAVDWAVERVIGAMDAQFEMDRKRTMQ